MNNKSWYAAKRSDMDVVRTHESDDFVVDYDRSRGMYRVTIFKDSHFWDEVWFDAYEEKEHFIIDFSKCASSEELIKIKDEINKTGIISAWDATPVVSIPVLIEWLSNEKYTSVDETSDNMTEEFEKEHQWELSRNCFINKVIRHLEQINF